MGNWQTKTEEVSQNNNETEEIMQNLTFINKHSNLITGTPKFIDKSNYSYDKSYDSGDIVFHMLNGLRTIYYADSNIELNYSPMMGYPWVKVDSIKYEFWHNDYTIYVRKSNVPMSDNCDKIISITSCMIYGILFINKDRV